MAGISDRISNLFFGNMKRQLDRMTFSLDPHYSDEPIERSDDAKLSFIVWGDPQISAVSPLRSLRVFTAVRDIRNIKTPLDALVLCGDLAEYGTWCEYRMLAELLSPVSDKFAHIFAVSGNHDIRIRNYGKQLAKFNRFLELLPNGERGSDEHYYFSKAVGGYKFIMLGADKNSFEASYISDRQLEWLDRELSENDDSGKPVFIFNHQPIKHTNGLPVTFLGRGKWRGSVGNESDKLRAVFEKHKNIIYITGHLHYCTSQYTYEDCGAFKAVSMPTVGVINHGAFKPFTQGYVFEVFADKIVARSRVFADGKYTDESVPNHRFEIAIK